jgi:hypothetical protein
MRQFSEQSDRLARLPPISWLSSWLHLMKVEPTAEPDAIQHTSWQDIHRRDTSWLIPLEKSAHSIVGHRRTIATVPETSMGASELGWVRQHAALVYLLRTGQWQPVPATPPDTWVERLVTEFSGITKGAARRILAAAIEAVPHPTMAPLLEPLSPDERDWALRNREAVHDLCIGRLRGIPTNPTRTWVTAFQSAVGGTSAEIAAILAIIVTVITNTSSTMIAAE